MPQETPLQVDEGLAETIAEALDWLESQTSSDLLRQKRIDILKDFLHDNFHSIAADHWYFSKCAECRKSL